MSTDTTIGTRGTRLPDWRSVLAVVAHPDDESFGLGAVLSQFGEAGADVFVVSLTEGEASTLGGGQDLGAVRRRELTDAANELGVVAVRLCHHPDSRLAEVDADALARDVSALVAEIAPDGLVVFEPDGVTGHPDHRAATRAALAAAAREHLPVLAWSVPAEVGNRLNEEFGTTFGGPEADEVDIVVEVDRTSQLAACRKHASQAVPGSVLWRRLELQGPRESLVWLRR